MAGGVYKRAAVSSMEVSQYDRDSRRDDISGGPGELRGSGELGGGAGRTTGFRVVGRKLCRFGRRAGAGRSTGSASSGGSSAGLGRRTVSGKGSVDEDFVEELRRRIIGTVGSIGRRARVLPVLAAYRDNFGGKFGQLSLTRQDTD